MILIYRQVAPYFLNNFGQWTLTLILSVILVSCKDKFEKSYYEKTTNIKFPDNYKFVATADNGEFMTIAILDLGKKDCKKFITEYNFEPITDFFPKMIGIAYLDGNLGKLPDRTVSLVKYNDKEPGKVGWTYLIDTTTCRLYCEIDYPDWDGN